MQFGAFFSAVGACKKAVDVVRDLSGVPDQAIHLWRLIDALEPPLSLVCRLQSRVDTADTVGSALAFCHEVLSLCDEVLVRADPDGRPFEAKSWAEWWGRVPAQTKESMTRIQLIPQLVTKVQQCVGVLQLALTTAQMSRLGTNRSCDGLWPIVANGVTEHGLNEARSILHLFEMGRINSPKTEDDVVYQLGYGRLFHKEEDLVSPNCALVLVRRGVEYCLHFLDVDDLSQRRGKASRHASGYKIIDGPTDYNEYTRNDNHQDSSSTEPRITAIFTASIPCQVRLLIDKRQSGRSSHRVPTLCVILTPSSGEEYLFEYQSCTVAGQFCWFPLGNEGYRNVSAEVLSSILAVLRAMNIHKSTHIDEIWPADSDVENWKL